MTITLEGYDNERLTAAIHFATDAHAGQFRKGTSIPYITHPLEVLSILMRMDADTDLLMAGVLHDTVEDSDATMEQINELFGEDVASLVAHHTEDKSKSWSERKEHAIHSIAQADRRVKMLVMADKLSNLRSIAADYSKLGDKLWERFNAPREKQSWYYSGMQDAFWDMQTDVDTAPAYWEMTNLYKDVFVRYCRSETAYEAENTPLLMQLCEHGEVHLLKQGSPKWMTPDEFGEELPYFEPISRKEAEQTEDEWNAPFWSRIEEDLGTSRKCMMLEQSLPLAELTIWEGKLTISGRDIGPQGEMSVPKNEYEYCFLFDVENTRRLMVQMRCEYGIEESFGELFAGKFPGDTFAASFLEYCDSHGVTYGFHKF